MAARVIDFDTIMLNPFSTYAELHREKLPYCRGKDGSWGVFKYDEVEFVLKNHADFSATGVEILMRPAWLDKSCQRSEFIAMQDPPLSDKNRKYINRIFIQRSIDALAEPMRENAIALTKTLPNKGDLIRNFSYPYIANGLSLLLGIEVNIDEIKKWINAVESITTECPPNKLEIEATIATQRQRFRDLIEEKKSRPSTDFFSKLILEHGEVLSDDDLLNIFELLIGAGFHTIIHFLSRAIIILSSDVLLREQLSQSPDLVSPFVDEALRLFPTVHSAIRKTTADVDMPNGYRIPKGSYVRAMIAAGNRDPDIFDFPDQVNIHRKNNGRHLTFGAGAHFCLGLQLAKMEAAIAIEVLIKAFDKIEISDDLMNQITMPNMLGLNSLIVSV
jgi:cytochrome P450